MDRIDSADYRNVEEQKLRRQGVSNFLSDRNQVHLGGRTDYHPADPSANHAKSYASVLEMGDDLSALCIVLC